MGLNLHCQSQPILEVDRWNARGVSEALAENRGFDPGCRPFEILPDTPNEIRFRLANNSEKLFPLGLPLRNIRLNYSQLGTASARSLDWILRNGRPISIGANFDKHTFWMSNFGGLGIELPGVAEVGLCANAGILRRDTDLFDSEVDYIPHIQAGYNAMIGRKLDDNGNRLPKIVPGMIGGACLFENGHRANLATRRYSASAVTTALQLWPNNDGSSETNVVVGQTTPTPLDNLGSNYIDHIMITPDSNGPAIWPSDRYVESADQTGLAGLKICISILARGSGGLTIGWAEGGVENDFQDFILSEDWGWYTLQVEPAGTGRVRLHGGTQLVSGGVYLETRCLQIEEGFGPSASFMDYDTVSPYPVNECIHIPEELNPHGFSMAFWVKYRNDDDDKPLFVYWPDLSGTPNGRLVLSIRGADMILEDTAGSTFEVTDCFLNIDDNTWTQIVMTREPGHITPKFNHTKFYVNGALQSSYQDSSAVRNTSLLGADPHLYIGGDAAQYAATPVAGSLNIPLDSARVDFKVWTAADVLADYELRSDTGMQTFLQMVQGRYFRPSQAYRPQGPFTDIYEGAMELREVDIRRQTVP